MVRLRAGRLARWLPLAGFLLAAACSTGATADAEDFAPEPYGDVLMEVRNLNFLDANLYVLTGSNRRRLGMVRSQQVATLRFSYAGPDAQIEIALVGGGTYLSDRVTVQPDDILELVIDPALDRKYWLRRR